MFMRCRVILIVRVFFYIFTSLTTTTTPAALSPRSPTPLRMCFWLRTWVGPLAPEPTAPTRARAHPSSNQEAHRLRSGLHPEGWESPLLPWACPMRDGQRIARRGPTNEEVSGQEKKPLPPEEKVWLSGPASRETVYSWQERSPVREIVAFCQAARIVCETFLVGDNILSPGISNLASKASEWLSTRALQTVVVVDFGSWVRVPPGGLSRCDRTRRDRYPRPALLTEDPLRSISFCACVCPWAPSVSRIV